MELGMIGLGRMGANLVRRLHHHDLRCVGFDRDAETVAALVEEGMVGATSLAELTAALPAPRAVWVMVPAGIVGDVLDELVPLLDPGDIVIDGGNSSWRDDIDRAPVLAERQIWLVDVGTSGGVYGLDRGFCLMIGGDPEPVARLTPVFDALAPGLDAASRTPDRDGDPGPGESGWLHCGRPGAGHFVKMIHNGIEYGMMASLAEGLAILDKADLGDAEQTHDAETAPLRDTRFYRYDLDTAAIAEVWRRGSVISSWLVDLTAHALAVDPALEGFEGRVSDSGEGRWTVQAAVDLGVPAHAITASLFERFASRGRSDFADRALSAMRQEFGGHHETHQEEPS
ncbi:MAG: decarboxylating 6-phosphogluconate dehydrogenase [Acidimicrobiia bacterium]|nr:decarboxylating 6-phosphogluconate dehydrogenase [Acidimicrobiia bacterium]